MVVLNPMSVVGVSKRRTNVVGGIVCAGDVPLGVPGASPLVVIHLWLHLSYAGYLAPLSVVGVRKRRVNVDDAIGLVVLYL